MKDYKEFEKEERTLTVKEMSPDEQPRERALKYGCGALTLAELWALILRTGITGTPITQLCRDLMNFCGGSLYQLERMEFERLLEVDGIGVTKALQIGAVMELVRRYNKEQVGKRMRIRQSTDIYDVMHPEIGNLPHEEVWALYLNRRNEIISKERITSGSSVASVFDIKKIIRQAILRKAESVVMCHNHPSGNLVPSIQDDQITRMLKDACVTMDLRMLDHVIVTPSGFYSYNDNGKL